MEGVFERALPKAPFRIFTLVVAMIAFLFSFRLASLQMIHGDEYRERAARNFLRKVPVFAERGVIFDRNGELLAWNEPFQNGESQQLLNQFSKRSYRGEAFSQLLGYVSYPKKDANGWYWLKRTTGEAGLEKEYDEFLAGENGSYIVEVNAQGEKLSENRIREPVAGQNLQLTIDAKLQSLLFTSLAQLAEKYHFIGGGAAMMDIQNGELLALVSYPEFSSQAMSDRDSEAVTRFLHDPRKPFFNRTVSGLYPPGSTVKPFIALAALNEDLITPETKILSTGKIEVPNPYYPEKPFTYRDWKREGHGWTDVRKAIAESVNTFFYAIGGGYEKQKGLGIDRMNRYLKAFGIGEETKFPLYPEHTGTIPNPEWKKEHFQDGTWRLGDTYISSIGQFGFLVSPLQMLRSVAAIANGGYLVQPKILLSEDTRKQNVPIEIPEEWYRVVREGMRQTVTAGTAQNLKDLPISFAVKTGTAQVGAQREYFDSWVIGFFPYEHPRYAIVVFLEKGKKGEHGSASMVIRDFVERLVEEYPQFIESVRGKKS